MIWVKIGIWVFVLGAIAAAGYGYYLELKKKWRENK